MVGDIEYLLAIAIGSVDDGAADEEGGTRIGSRQRHAHVVIRPGFGRRRIIEIGLAIGKEVGELR